MITDSDMLKNVMLEAVEACNTLREAAKNAPPGTPIRDAWDLALKDAEKACAAWVEERART